LGGADEAVVVGEVDADNGGALGEGDDLAAGGQDAVANGGGEVEVELGSGGPCASFDDG
jgi:hypothetical protein